MNAARITASFLAFQCRLTGNLKPNIFLQPSSAIICAFKKIRPICFTINCRQGNQGNADEGTNVTYQEFVQHLKSSSSTVIDVRNPEELVETGIFPGSINIPFPHLAKTLELPDEQFQYLYGVPKPKSSDNIIFTCKMGIRSHKAISIALGKGFQNAQHYPGGWLGWIGEQSKANQ